MNTPVRIAVTGCGHWGKNLVRNFHELGFLAAVCDVNEELAATFSAKYKVPRRTLEEILADDSIDALAVAVPAAQHAAVARRALEAGKHVFVEKPIALDLGDADELCRLAASRQRVLMVGHLLRYHSAFQKLAALANAGELGRIQYAYSNRLNLGRFRTEENSLWSFAPHDISMILALLGDRLESVYATGEAYLHKHLADVTTTHLHFESGQAAHIHVSWLHPFKEQRLVVVGDHAMAVFDDGQPWPNKLVLYRHQITWNEGVPSPARGTGEPIELVESEPLRAECAHFAECVATGATPQTDGREGLRVLRVLDAAQRSMETGAPIRFHAEDRAFFAHDTAVIDAGATVGSGTRIWHFSHVLSGSKIGEGCNIGQNVVIGPDVQIGNGCKIQNNVSIYKGVTLEDQVFCGPSMVFTNVTTPRSEVNRKSEYANTLVKHGATIGANATIVCPVTLHEYCFVGAGAVVTKDVPAYALVVGNPAHLVGWACRCGETLEKGDWKKATCDRCGTSYERHGEGIRPAGEKKPKKKKRKKA